MKRTIVFATAAVLAIAIFVSTRFFIASIALLAVWAAFVFILFAVVMKKKEETEQERWRVIAAQENVLKKEVARASKKAEYKARLEAEIKAVEEAKEREAEIERVRIEEHKSKARSVLEAEIRAAREAEVREAREAEIEKLKEIIKSYEDDATFEEAITPDTPQENASREENSSEDKGSWQEPDDICRSLLKKKNN